MSQTDKPTCATCQMSEPTGGGKGRLCHASVIGEVVREDWWCRFHPDFHAWLASQRPTAQRIATAGEIKTDPSILTQPLMVETADFAAVTAERDRYRAALDSIHRTHWNMAQSVTRRGELMADAATDALGLPAGKPPAADAACQHLGVFRGEKCAACGVFVGVDPEPPDMAHVHYDDYAKTTALLQRVTAERDASGDRVDVLFRALQVVHRIAVRGSEHEPSDKFAAIARDMLKGIADKSDKALNPPPVIA